MIKLILMVFDIFDKVLEVFGYEARKREELKKAVNKSVVDVADELARSPDLRENEREARDHLNNKVAVTTSNPVLPRFAITITGSQTMKKFEVTFDNGNLHVVGDLDTDGNPGFELKANAVELLTELWDFISKKSA